MLRTEITFIPHALHYTSGIGTAPPRFLTKVQGKAMCWPSISLFKSGYRVFVRVKIDC
jgi:hypothetical protein